jgi:hypothetical protein
VLLQLGDITGVGGAPSNNATLSGIPTAPTANPGTSTGQLATTAFVQAAVSASVGGVASFNTRTGAVTLTGTDITGAGGALTAGPAFSGTPTAPTAPNGTTTTQLATCAFVMNEIAGVSAGVTTFNTRSGNVVLSLADVTTAGGAPVASPAFSGIPTAPTATAGTNTTQIATTQFVATALGGVVTAFNGRTGSVSLQWNDVSAVGGAPVASPVFTGIPQGPTAAPGTSNTELATTQFVMQAVGTISPTVVQSTPPASPTTGQLWWNNSDGQGYVWTGAQWVVFVNPPLPNLATYVTQTQLNNNTLPGSLLSLAVSGTSSLDGTTVTTLSASGAITPTGGIVGVTNGSNAAAGMVGEVQIANQSGNLVLAADNSWQAVISLTLAAGDWDVQGWGGVTTQLGTSGAGSLLGISLNLAGEGGGAVPGPMNVATSTAQLTNVVGPTLTRRVSVTASTTVTLYAIGIAPGVTKTAQYCLIWARRVR